MRLPQVKFIPDTKRDVRTFFDFWGDGSLDDEKFREQSILKKYPVFRLHQAQNKVPSQGEVKEFVERFYAEHQYEVERNIIRYQLLWKKKEKDFFKLTSVLFGGNPWPKGKYLALPTMWGMYPRFLDDKTFQFPALAKTDANVIIICAHEMLHFIFYAYIGKTHRTLLKDKEALWHVSEIFNAIILSTSPWWRVFRKKDPGYPEHAKIIRLLMKKYGKGIFAQKDTDILIKEIYQEVLKENL